MTVKVQDNGPGVPEAQQSLVFDRFHQGGDATQRPHGTGLGLPISQQIVTHFGGRLWLEQTPGEGACFAFHLPWIDSPGGVRNKNKETRHEQKNTGGRR